MVSGEGMRRAAIAIGAAGACFAAPVRAGDTDCPAVWPPRAPVSSVRELDAAGLLAIRDIGQPDGFAAASPLAVSPDGRRIAFFLSQPVLSVNDRCETLIVLDLQRPSEVRVIDSGGSGIRWEEVLRGVRRPSGIFDLNVPVWSPDGRWLAYRKRMDGRTQVWRAGLDGAPPEQVSHATQDVETLGWSRDGTRLLFTIRPGRAEFAAASAAEAREGYLYDARVLPHLAVAPQLPADLPEVTLSIEVADGDVRRATADEEAGFARPVLLSGLPLGPVVGPDGVRAGADPDDKSYYADRRVWAERSEMGRTECAHEICTGRIRAVWWLGRQVLFLKREGWHRETSAIYGWEPGSRQVRTLIRTRDWISGCAEGATRELVCLVESSREPRRLVAIDPESGHRRLLLDPNPEIDSAGLPGVRRLRWRNKDGLEAWGDLVIPHGRPPKGGWPLVIVQYTSEGFLRGGTGDEYPIYPLASRGIAVLSFDAPDRKTWRRKDLTDVTAMVAAGHKDWADRRSINDSLMRGIDLALALGDLNPDRIGISGLSDGSTTTRFALINNDRFAAAAISSCCLEPHSMMTHGGIAQADWFRSVGFPPASRSEPAFWLPGSMAMNAERMDTPLLMQLSDDEYLQGLETFTALREHGKPVELYVFPGEHHNKWQPQHRAAIYERNIDWFSFWLQDHVDPDPAKAAQYERWQAMRGAPVSVSAP